MYGPTTQCISKTYYQMFQLSVTVPNLCPQPKSSLINHLINDRQLDVGSDVAPAPIALPTLSNLCTKV